MWRFRAGAGRETVAEGEQHCVGGERTNGCAARAAGCEEQQEQHAGKRKRGDGSMHDVRERERPAGA